jgi:hypothetical protein
MKAPISQATPIDARQGRQQNAGERGKTGANHESREPDSVGVDAEGACQRLVHDHRACGEAEPCPFDREREQNTDRKRGEQHEQSVDRIVDGQHTYRSGHKVRDELNVAAKRQRDEFAYNNPESPGRKDRIKRTTVERPNDEEFGDPAQESSCNKGDRQAGPRIKSPSFTAAAELAGAASARAVREIDDLEHAEYWPTGRPTPRTKSRP